MCILNAGDKYDSSLGELYIIRLLGRGKSGYSYLADNGNSRIVLKIMHDEPNPYYSFTGNKVEAETDSYNKLSSVLILMPELLAAHPNENYLIKEYIPGTIASELIAAGKLDETIIRTLFEYAAHLKSAGLNIDYFPNNFVVTAAGKLYYIDYETNVYSSEWDLENWGIYYWANSDGFAKFLATGDASFINSDQDKGIPVKAGHETLVNKWIAYYSK